MNRFAVISDVHGNRWALEAVLRDIDRHGITDVVNLGDVFYGPLDPRGTADILFKRDDPTVCGNEDRIIFDKDAPGSDTLEFVRKQLADQHLEWLRNLPFSHLEDGIYACHASPESDTAYLLWKVEPSVARPSRPLEVEARLTGMGFEIGLCGHDHVPRSLRLDDGRLIVNPGSVGLPAYWDAEPHEHVMQTGSPHARYCVIEKTDAGWSIEQVAVTYDWRSAARAARINGRPDWADWLSTGRASEHS